MALSVFPSTLIDRLVCIYHFALSMSLPSEPLAFVLSTIFVSKDTLAFSLASMKTASVLKPKLPLLANPMGSKTVLMVV